jgi:replicative DNA helicase
VIDSKELPLEYQLFALSFQEEGAIVAFAEELPVHEVCAIDENAGIKEFYQALLDYHKLTEQPIVEPIAFRSWLETTRDTYSAIDAFIGIDTFMDTVMSIETSKTKDVIAVLKDRHRTRKQINFVQELQAIFQSKEHKSDADLEKIDKLTAQIAELQQRVDYNPLAKVKFATDIVDSIDEMFTIPPFLSTPFETLNCALGYNIDGGMFRGAVHAIVATSGKGKSTLAKTMANHWLDSGYSVLIHIFF